MRRMIPVVLLIGLSAIASVVIGLSALTAQTTPSKGKTYYVRQTVGDNANDGLSPKAAWRSISRLGMVIQAGDTAYVGPGLYREEITVRSSGTAESRIVFIADTTGQHTGDPPGVVMITGAEPVTASLFVPHSAPGVYTAKFPRSPVPVLGVVEMDGDQYRYRNATTTKEYLVDKMAPLDVVAKLPSSFYDEQAQVLYIHTSDGQPPSAHEIEVVRRNFGIVIVAKQYVTVTGFTFRHMGDAGIGVFAKSGNVIALNNTSYGSRQGIRVDTATDVLVYGNTLFRNENSGVYFLARSTSGVAIGNITYENVKGVRWSSQSVNGMAIDNAAFDNHEYGISIEDVDHAILRRNKMVNNKIAQLLALRSEYSSAENCFQNSGPHQLTTYFYLFPTTGRYRTLAEYQNARHQDLHSREGGCGPMLEKTDVRKLHAETMSYADRARKTLGGS